MSVSGNSEFPGIEKMYEKIQSLEERLAQLESQLKSGGIARAENVTNQAFSKASGEPGEEALIRVDKTTLESNIVEYGLAWLGSIVLLFGIVFLMTFTQNHVNNLVSSLIGYVAVAGIFILSHYLRHSFPHLSFMLVISGHLLVYYVTLRLFFFSQQPVIPLKGIVIFLLLSAVTIQIYFSIRKKSELLAVLGILLSLATALFSDITHVTLPLITLTAVAALFLFIKYSWWRLLITTLILVYLSHMIWLLNNPVVGHSFKTLSTHQFNLIYLFVYGAIFSFTSLVRQKGLFPNSVYYAIILLNGIFFSMVILLNTVTFYMGTYAWIFIGIAFICLFYSVFLKSRTNRLFDPAFFAIYSFMALSVAIYGFMKFPGAYFLLSLQSLLVVSWALWFRSRIIVVMNTLLFMTILAGYLVFSQSLNTVNFSFVITAFISARIINWQKERLTLKTEMIRNSYLIVLFFTMLYALYHAVPGQYVTPSWTAAAVLYFILSLILRNIKYRWMAIATLLVTAGYLFAVDLAHMEVGYRVIAFLFLAAITLGASLYFTRSFRKKRNQASQQVE